MGGLYFEEFEIGDRFETAGRTITEADVVNFAGIVGDFSPVHVDAEYAAETAFGSRIAHGPLTFGVGIGLTTQLTYSEGTLVALYGIDSLRFPTPVYLGDTVRVVQEVTALDARDGDGIVTLETTVRNQDAAVCAVWDHMKIIESAPGDGAVDA
jgi:acyl dehydratase